MIDNDENRLSIRRYDDLRLRGRVEVPHHWRDVVEEVVVVGKVRMDEDEVVEVVEWIRRPWGWTVDDGGGWGM